MLRFGPEYPSQGKRPLGGNEACRVTTHGWVPEGEIFRSEPKTYQIFSLAYSAMLFHI
jgi:hypothetical protein